MMCTSDNKQFIDKILGMKSKDIKLMLKQQDQKYLVRKKLQIIQNMPQHLKPNYNIQTKATSILKSILHVNYTNPKLQSQNKLSHFPSTFHQKSKVNHFDMNFTKNNQKINPNKLSNSNSKGFLQNLMSNFEGFKSSIDGQANLWKGQRLPQIPDKLDIKDLQLKPQNQKQSKLESHINLQKPLQGEILIQKQALENKMANQSGQQADIEQNSNFTYQNIDPNRESQMRNPFAPPQYQKNKYSPFISNKTNFLDLHTNKKPFQQTYLTPQTSSMNMLQYAHNQKRQNMFNDGYSYPNVIMGSSGGGWMKTAQSIRQNPFKKTFVSASKYEQYQESQGKNQMSNNQASNIKTQSDMKFRQNVQDVLKYTLGDRRYQNSINDRNNELAQSINIKSNMLQSSFNKGIPVKKQRVLQNPFVRRPASTYKY